MLVSLANNEPPTVTITEHSSASSDQQRIKAEQVKALYQQASMSAISSWATGLVVMFIPHPASSRLTLYAWFLMLTFSCSLRLFLVWRFKKSTIALHQYRRWGHMYALAIALTACVWSSTLFLLASPEDFQHQLLFLVILIAMCIGASQASTSYHLAGRAYFIPAMGTFTVYCFMHGDPVFTGLAVMAILYTLMMDMVGRDSNQRFFEIQRLRFELAQKKEEAESANIAKSKFLAAASHDLRQPLHALTLFTNALKEKITAPDVAKIVANIDKSIDALQGLFNALLDISKLDAGSMTVEKQHVTLDSIISPIANEFLAEAENKGLRLNIGKSSETVYTDPALLNRVIRNLVSNAIRYTEQGSITLKTEVIGDKITLRISDTGRGIPTDMQEEVFKEFFQLDNPERDREKGLGLGLAIVKRLTGLLEHPLQLDSAPERGSCFTLELPLGTPQVITPVSTPPPMGYNVDSYNSIEVIVIDDEASVREGALALLDAWGYRASAFNDVSTCIQTLKEKAIRPNVILADYRLQGHKTGVEAIEEINQFLGENIDAAIITGDTAPDRIQEAEASGYLLMHKPFKPMQLRAFLNRVQQKTKATVSAV